MTGLILSRSGEAFGADDSLFLERRNAIAKQFELLKDTQFTGQIVTQWAHLIQREVRSLDFGQADEIARKWCFSTSDEGGFTSLVVSVAGESVDASRHVQFVTYHFSENDAVAVADRFTRVLTPGADVLKRKGVVDVTLPGDRIIAKPRIDQLRFHPPAKLPVVADSSEPEGQGLRLKYYSGAGKMTLSCLVDDAGFVSEWSKLPDGEQFPTEIVYQSQPISVTAGYFPRRAVRLRLHQSRLVDFTVNEILNIDEGREIPSDAVAVAIPQGTVVIDSRDKEHPETAVARRELTDWRDAFDAEKNHPSAPGVRPTSIAIQTLIVTITLIGGWAAMRGLSSKKVGSQNKPNE